MHVAEGQGGGEAKDVCFKCNEKGHYSKNCAKKSSFTMCFRCGKSGHIARQCSAAKEETGTATNVTKSAVQHVNMNLPNLKYFKDVKVSGKEVKAYFDLGSQVCALREDQVTKLKLNCNWDDETEITGYGGAVTKTIGSVHVQLEADGVAADVKVHIVPNEVQGIPLIVRHPYTEQQHIKLVKTPNELVLNEIVGEEVHSCGPVKVALWAKDACVIPNNFLGHVTVKSDVKETDLCIEGGLREVRGFIPRVVVKTDANGEALLPVFNISGEPVKFSKD